MIIVKCSPAPVTNQRAFDLHRGYLEAELRRAQPIPPCAPYVDPDLHQVMWYGSVWMGRYMRRRHSIEGVFDGPLADVGARELLVARHRTRDALIKAMPDWTPFMLSMMNMSLLNASRSGGLEVSSMEQPHSYGPSLRALWAEAKRLGKSDADAWEHILVWGRHRPACWDRMDERKKKRQPLVPPALVERLARTVTWKKSDDLDHPWTIELDAERWQIRLNDFPDDTMYSLAIDAAAIGDFHDWPATWQRD